ncbi:hypothetical protein AMTRI_Chr05g57930 [Amborella trichopoda]|uniref:Protein kinase domain-containing protein n=1 Tax=Amborella trichopoda TaxID=13333 RepID=U5CYT5_AMBTC|nr:probably inactive leucine-rich repeat receptor-like protein kinase At2g25790 [Amborella trichopoda]XP_011626728.1 probably inactive leucine-rich repeat receptor-like protein kinase At2g25790 [Amborella trichopoda]XP_020528752.1 probably inactive leucine-rich repeat receptor-like protein kinase At2g25790 [Amborella trichopoda]ERN15115.1 hypothetical protein AMTR_s00056p00090780 [Amborella trichopoda]|eukprot:XP_006853648.1 probably inactive leucine-rich repeat receptor-like protein kinase At2g25790 [Amborella trichopoda]
MGVEVTEKANKKPLLLLCIFLLHALPTSSQASDELKSLLYFKSTVMDPLKSLSSWADPVNLPLGFSYPLYCNWSGVLCNSELHVREISLASKNLSGTLESLDLLQFPFVEAINLGFNNFTGALPLHFLNSTSLKTLNLSSNSLSGSIPKASAQTLETIDLSNNFFSGSIPLEIGYFSGLKVLDLGGNSLTGQLPPSIWNLTALRNLTLASNQLTGKLLPEIGNLLNLEWIYLGYNNFSGEIPSEIGQLKSLKHLNLVYNNLTGSIPPTLGNLRGLKYLYLYQNKLTASIPGSFFNLTELVSLDLSDNELNGTLSEDMGKLHKLEVLNLFSNCFHGAIPQVLALLPCLHVLALWANGFSGEIPTNLGKKSNLTELDLSTNYLTGEIPASLCDSKRLYKLILFSNKLNGTIPYSLGHCSTLRRVRLQNNSFSGELPPEISKLPVLYFLDISMNKLSGKLDGRKWDTSSLQVLKLASNRFSGNLPEFQNSSMKLETLDLSENQFSGVIPASYGDLSELTLLNLGWNQISHEIPAKIGECKKLVTLDLSHNRLTGGIPVELAGIPVLGDLDLSENQLTGKIPAILGDMDSLLDINVSHNRLRGKVPVTGAFLTINFTALAGNPGLCGLVSGLTRCKTGSGSSLLLPLAVFLGILGALSGVLLFWLFRRRKSQRKKVDTEEDDMWTLEMYSNCHVITVDDVLNTMNKESLISKGRTGSLYKGRTDVKGLTLAVKELAGNRDFLASFWPELSDSGNVRHRNIVRLLGTCRSEATGILIYEYISGWNLGEIMHGSEGKKLGWHFRLKIAAGISRALEYLHCKSFPARIHGCVLPEKVIVGEDGEPRLKLVLPGTLRNNSKGFLASGYAPPEFMHSKEFTEKNDIYGFGVLLIELLTGKGPSEPGISGHGDLVGWAHYCYAECATDTWLDPGLREEMVEYQGEMARAMHLAVACTRREPMARPCATEIVRELESMRGGKSWLSTIFRSMLILK